MFKAYALLFFVVSFQGTAYVPNTIIGTITNLPANTRPSSLTISPEGTTMYVPSYSNSTVGIVDMATNVVTGLVSNPNHAIQSPWFIAINPSGTTGYICNVGHNNIGIFDTATQATLGQIFHPALQNPWSMVITPNGQQALVTSQSFPYVTVINLQTNIVLTAIRLGGTGPFTIAMTADGTKAYVAHFADDSLSIIDVTSKTNTGTITGTFSGPIALAFTPQNTKAYVCNSDNNTVSIIDVRANKVIGLVNDPQATFSAPSSVAITPDGKTAYIVNNTGNSISIVEVATDTVTGTVTDTTPPTITRPRYIAITPNGELGYIMNGTNVISILFIAMSPAPINAQGVAAKNVFLTQTERFNRITWEAPPTSGTTQYKIYRNAQLTQLAATVSANRLQYIDHNRQPKTTYNYYIVAVDSVGNASLPAHVSVVSC